MERGDVHDCGDGEAVVAIVTSGGIMIDSGGVDSRGQAMGILPACSDRDDFLAVSRRDLILHSTMGPCLCGICCAVA